MDYIIGVDGGGTKTEAAAFDLKGNKLSKGFAGFGNLLINEEEAISNIINSIKKCQESLNENDCRFICLGLAGYGGVKNPAYLKKALTDTFNIPFIIVNDSIIAHAAFLKGKDGILTISGTGSVSTGIYKGKELTVGGWGHLLGDEGSGYWISMQIFKKMTQNFDKGLENSHLTRSILSKLGLHSINDLKKFIYSVTKAEIAAIVPDIVKSAEIGDEFSQAILKEAGKHLATTALSVWNRLDFEEKNVTIALKGSILTHIPMIQKSFIAHIKSQKPNAEFILHDVSSTIGCYYISMKHITESIN